MDENHLIYEIEELRDIRMELKELAERAGELDVELDEAEITKAIEARQTRAAQIHEAELEALRREYEVMSL